MTNWKELALGEIVTMIDYRGKTPKKTSSGIPLITAKIVKNGRIYPPTEFISKEEYKERMTRGLPKVGDVLITTEAPLGEIAELKDANVSIGQRLITMRADENMLHGKYLKYYLQSKEGQSKLSQRESGTTVIGIKQAELRKVLIPLPPLEMQKKIAGVLGALDDKIELNNKINNNLEQQAQALFKSWFVDFEPFGGVMPEDWKIGKLKDVLKLKKTPIRAGENCALPYLPIDIIPIHSLALTEFRPNSEAQSSLITFDKDDILIGAMRVYFHRVTIAPCAGITRTTCFVLSPFDESYLLYALLLCNQDKSIEFAQTTSKGSTMPYAVWDGGLGDLEINIPQRNIVEKFNNILLPSIRQIQNSYFENTRLAAIRDALLPKLMSGEIDVSKVNISADKLLFTED